MDLPIKPMSLLTVKNYETVVRQPVTRNINIVYDATSSFHSVIAVLRDDITNRFEVYYLVDDCILFALVDGESKLLVFED